MKTCVCSAAHKVNLIIPSTDIQNTHTETHVHTYIHTHTHTEDLHHINSLCLLQSCSFNIRCLFSCQPLQLLCQGPGWMCNTKHWQADLSQAWWRRNSQEDSKVKKEEEKKPFLVFRYMDTALPNLRCVSVHEYKEWDEFPPCQPQDHQRFPTQMQDCEHNWGVTTLYPVHPAAPA